MSLLMGSVSFQERRWGPHGKQLTKQGSQSVLTLWNSTHAEDTVRKELAPLPTLGATPQVGKHLPFSFLTLPTTTFTHYKNLTSPSPIPLQQPQSHTKSIQPSPSFLCSSFTISFPTFFFLLIGTIKS